MPEEAEAQESVADILTKPLRIELRHHGAEPQQASGHVHTVTSHQGEEGGEEGAAAGTGAACDQAHELAHFERDEREAEEPGGKEGELSPLLIPLTDGKARHPAGKGRGEEATGLHRRIMEIEQLLCGRTSRGVLEEHRVGGEETREHDHVGEQEDPKAVPDDYALGCRSAGATPGHLKRRMRSRWAGSQMVRTGRCAQRLGAHGASSRKYWARAWRLAWPIRATSSAGTSNSATSRQAKTTKVM